MMLRSALILTTVLSLAACAGEDVRREYLYKPVYCLASGLASIDNDDCMPEALKSDLAAVAKAQLETPAAPAVARNVYYTNDQRLAMGLVIAASMFEPNKKLTRSSVALSLDAGDLYLAESCALATANKRITDHVAGLVNDRTINRETAKFLAEHYSDLQLSELYRVAKANGTLADVPDDAFLVPDAKDAKKTVNVKPQSGRGMGSILSYTTSRAVSEVIGNQRKSIEAEIANIKTTAEAEECAPPVIPVTVTEPTAEVTP